jgi:hypothetical protein
MYAGQTLKDVPSSANEQFGFPVEQRDNTNGEAEEPDKYLVEKDHFLTVGSIDVSPPLASG